MKIEAGKKYRVKAHWSHDFEDGEIVTYVHNEEVRGLWVFQNKKGLRCTLSALDLEPLSSDNQLKEEA